jgi:hypothetical protein
MNENINYYAKKYKLTDEQIMTYAWLKEQRLNTDDGTLCFWSKTYPAIRIKEVVEFANARIMEGQKIENMGGWVQKLLKSKLAVVNDVCRVNRKYAIEFTKAWNWKDLRIYEKYVKDNITGDDLPLTMAIDDFKRSLENLHQKSQTYQ